jgi:monovalent cation/hydrogen antiporter
VIAGLWLSQAGPRVIRAEIRQQAEAFWSLSAFLLNGALFVLIGLQVHAVVRGQGGADLTTGLLAVAAVSATVIGARFAWLFTTPYLIRAIDRRPRQRSLRTGARPRVVSALSGFRGAVSLAAALAVPQTLLSGRPFPGRSMIVFVTAGVIVVTLAQALILPGVVRWARLGADTSVAEERHSAEIQAAEEALAAIPKLAERLDIDPKVADKLGLEYERHLRVLRAGGQESDDEATRRFDQQNTELRLAVLANKRATVVRLRDEGRIEDIVLRHIQTRLDIEEVRLTRYEAIE